MTEEEVRHLLTAQSVGFWEGILFVLFVIVGARLVVRLVIDVREHLAYRRALRMVQDSVVES